MRRVKLAINEKFLFIVLTTIALLISCTCSSSGTSLSSLSGNESNKNDSNDNGIVLANIHSPVFAKSENGTLLMHEKLSSYEQKNPIFGKTILGLIIRPDTTETVDFLLEDRNVQLNEDGFVFSVKQDPVIPLGNFSCEEIQKKLRCEISGMDTIVPNNNNELSVYLDGVPNTSTSVILKERSQVREDVKPYIIATSSAGTYNLRTGEGNLPSGYSFTLNNELGINETYNLTALPETTEIIKIFFTHNYHYYDLKVIDTHNTADILVSFKKIPNSTKFTCNIFDENLGERSGLVCEYNPTIIASTQSVEMVFSNTYPDVNTAINGSYKINY